MTAPALLKLSITGLLLRRDRVALQFQPVGVGKALLVDIDFHRDRHAGERADVLVARDRGIDGCGLRQHVFRAVIDHGVDRRD